MRSIIKMRQRQLATIELLDKGDSGDKKLFVILIRFLFENQFLNRTPKAYWINVTKLLI